MDKIEVTQADQLLVADVLDEVSSLLDHNGIGQIADLIRDGEYDEHDCVKIAARHRLATRTDATPVAWDDLANAIRMELIFFRDGAVFDAQVKNETDILMQLVRAFVDPPATDVAALVENGCEMPEVAAMRYIEELRSDLAASVTILCDNEEAWTKDEQMAVEVIAEWTDWIAKRFMGESVIQCLARAIGARATLAALKDRTHG